MGFMWGIFKEYIKQKVIMVVLRKANAHSVSMCRSINKSITYNKIQGERLIQTLIFPKLPGVYKVLIKRDVI